MGRLTKALVSGIEKRDSIANPTRWLISALGQGGDTASGIRVSENLALRESTVFACVRIISESLSALPMPVFARTPDGGKVRAPQHYAYRLLDKAPNPRMTSFAWKELCFSQLLLWGNSYNYLDFNQAGRVKAIWPLLADRTRPMLVDGNLVYETRLKQDPNSISTSDNKQLMLPADQVLHIVGLSPDGLKGYSPIQLLRENIGTALALQEFAGRLFGNGALPGMILKSPGNLSPEQKTLLKTTFEEGHQGLTNAHRMAILEAGLSIEKVSINPDEAQFIESRKFSRSEIAAIFRVPLFLIGEVERGASYASLEQSLLGFHTLTLMPWARRFEQCVNLKLFPESEQDTFFAEFLPAGLLKGDHKSRFEAYHLARQDGWMSVNDIRDAENMNRVDGGDIYLSPLNMQPVGTDPSTPDAAPSLNDPGTGNRVGIARRKLMDAQQPTLRAEAVRIMRRERSDIIEAAGKRTINRAWVENFYRDLPPAIESWLFPVFESFAAVVRADVERELGREIPVELGKFIRKYTSSFADRYIDSSLDILRYDQTNVALERALGPGNRRPERLAEYESIRAGNAFALEVYRAAGVEPVIAGTDDCDRNVTTRHLPLKDGCDCVLLSRATRASGTASSAEAETLTAALNVALAAAERPVSVSVTTPEVTIQPANVSVPITVQGPTQAPVKFKYDRDGRLSETRPSS